jgi:hypothetical protein
MSGSPDQIKESEDSLILTRHTPLQYRSQTLSCKVNKVIKIEPPLITLNQDDDYKSPTQQYYFEPIYYIPSREPVGETTTTEDEPKVSETSDSTPQVYTQDYVTDIILINNYSEDEAYVDIDDEVNLLE